MGLARGILIAIEGIDGAGKTTQANAIAERIRSVGLEVVTSKEPTQGPWGAKIRESAGSVRMPVEAELHAFIEDRRAHVRELIEPALQRGAVVIIDRYYFSNAAYQGIRGLDPDAIIRTNEAFAPRPDLLVVIDVPVDVGLERIKTRGDVANQFEQPGALQQSAEIFRRLGRDGAAVIDGCPPAEVVTREVLGRLLQGPLFKALCLKPYKTECEPAYCSFRDRCGYPQLGALAPVTAPVWTSILRDGQLFDDERIEALVAAARR